VRGFALADADARDAAAGAARHPGGPAALLHPGAGGIRSAALDRHPGGVVTVTTALFQSIHSGFVPRYGEASAYACCSRCGVAPLFLYYRATKESAKFATSPVGASVLRAIDLGKWKYPCGLWS